MAEKFPYTLQEPATLLFSSITQKSAPPNTNAEPKFSGTFGIGEKDFGTLLPIQVQAITSETGAFSGNPEDYYLSCMSGKTAASRVRRSADLNAQAEEGKGNADKAFQIREKAEKKASVYETFPGILTAASKFDIELAHLVGGKIADITEPHAIAAAGDTMFYPGAKVVPKIAVQGFRRKKLDDKDGCTAFLQNCLFIAKGPKISLGGGGPKNQEVYSGFTGYSDYDPTAMAPGGSASEPVSQASAPPPPAAAPPPVADLGPVDPAHRHNNGNGTEQWYLNGAWDGGAHPIAAAAPPPPSVPAPAAAEAAPAW